MVCGVDRKLIEDYLELIRDYYRKADRAIYFMEEVRNIEHNSPIANLRDTLSHLASLLDPKTPAAKLRAQIENGEEHLRRAILEPYFIVLGRDRKGSRALLKRYEAELLPAKRRFPALADAPDMESVTARLREVARLTKKGRAAKAMNLWDPRWEEGAGAVIKAYVKHRRLYETILKNWREIRTM